MMTIPSDTRRSVTPARVVVVRDGVGRDRADDLVTEEPMEIRVAGCGQAPVSVAVTMRTPGADFELAVGFLASEGLIGAGDVASVRYCDLPEDADQRYNIVTVGLRRPFRAPPSRSFAINASCGLCGKASLDEFATRCPVVTGGPVIAGELVAQLPGFLQREQRLFATTGGLHGAGLFDQAGILLAIREDIGRHNAVDKLVGHAVLKSALPLTGHVLVVSGRVSFEIVEKAAMAGLGLIAAVSAPSSLAVDAARRFGITLIGFIRTDHFNVYTHPYRVRLTST